MKKFSRWVIFAGIVLVFGALTAFVVPQDSPLDTSETPLLTDFQNQETTISPSRLAGDGLPPAPNENPCLHCHIVGQEIGAWTPLWRWLSFGLTGLIFLFGITRSLKTWDTREQWKPFRVRMAEMVNVADPFGRELDTPAPKWLSRVWYALGGILMVFFVVQGISGIINYYHLDPLVFDPEIDTHAQLILSIKAAHWGIGVFLLVIMLGFNLIGSLLKSAQRSFWATMLIIGGVFGVPSIVQLSRGYFDPELLIPTSHVYAMHAVLISALLANIVIMRFIVTYKPSEE